MVFGFTDFLQKMNEQIRFYYNDTSGRLVFVRFLEEIDDPKKPFRNYLTFSNLKFLNPSKFESRILKSVFLYNAD